MSKPDKDIEDFWLSFKCSINNFYREFKINKNIEQFSKKLNKLQVQKKYSTIEYNIHYFICSFIVDVLHKINNIVINRSTYLYHVRIILTNIKRWRKIRLENKFFKDLHKNENMYYLMADCLKYSIKLIEKKNHDEIIILFFSDITGVIKYKEYNFITEYAIEIESETILKLVRNHFDIISYINSNFKIKLQDNLSGKKIIKFLKLLT
tara:strand:- start:7156 stop:7779 length:624 start_codon:yes stop_codon:yes gene_type:complete